MAKVYGRLNKNTCGAALTISRSLSAPVFAVEYRKCPGAAATAVLDDLMLRIELVMQGEGL